jgi:3-deoxy-manno-octulosonate cytidylyltransferase (CMP-KDO synthetase)
MTTQTDRGAGSVTLIIPARYRSSRFPGKPLAALRGTCGTVKPLVQWAWDAAQAVAGVERRIVATDDARIADTVTRFGGEAILTSTHLRNGTERCAEAARLLGIDDGIVVNLQGDAPLTPPHAIAAMIAAMRTDPTIRVATPRVRCTRDMVDRLLDSNRAGVASGTTVVVDSAGNALYFSKRVLPYLSDRAPRPPVYLHLGAYAYRLAALERYLGAGPSPLEESEGLEQLRFLHAGVSIRTVEIPMPRTGLWEVNLPSDVAPVEAGLCANALA